MLYAIIARDIPNSYELRTATRPRHMAWLKETLIDTGNCRFAGPHPAIDSPDPGPAGFSGSLIIGEFDSLKDAKAWAAQDPYAVDGVFEDVAIKPLLQAYP